MKSWRTRMERVFIIFIVVFFAVSVVGLVASIINGKIDTLSKNCRSASRMAFIIGLILLYLSYVFK